MKSQLFTINPGKNYRVYLKRFQEIVVYYIYVVLTSYLRCSYTST